MALGYLETLFDAPASACRLGHLLKRRPKGCVDLEVTAYPKAIEALQTQERLPKNTTLRQVKYLNNLIEQDHRFIKRLTKTGLGFKSWRTAWKTLRGYESMHMIRKGQRQGIIKGEIVGQIRFVESLFGLVA